MYNGSFKSSVDPNIECSFYEGEGVEKMVGKAIKLMSCQIGTYYG